MSDSLYKGYALAEYETMAEAQAAIDGASGTTLLEQTLSCDFAFVRPPPSGPKRAEVGKDVVVVQVLDGGIDRLFVTSKR